MILNYVTVNSIECMQAFNKLEHSLFEGSIDRAVSKHNLASPYLFN